MTHRAQKPPALIASFGAVSVIQKRSEFGAIYSCSTAEGVTLYQSNRKQDALAWLDGYKIGLTEVPRAY